MTKLAIEIKDLEKIYNTKGKDYKALDSISLEIPEGSFFGLLGPNGAGKSTIINILAGITVKTSGSAKICGYDIEEFEREAKSSIGVVPQEAVLDPFFTVKETLQNHSGYYGIPKKDWKIDEIIDAVGLTDKKNQWPRGLSGGMRRRLLIAKAMVHSPPVLILDEPSAGVDIEMREQLWRYIRKLHKSGVTIVLTTHYLEEAEQLCDEIAIIDKGSIIACDSKSKLLSHMDLKQINIHFENELSFLPDSFKSNQDIDYCLNKDNSLTIKYKTSKMSFNSILDNIQKTGLTIQNLTTQEADLEDVFKQLTTNIVREF